MFLEKLFLFIVQFDYNYHRCWKVLKNIAYKFSAQWKGWALQHIYGQIPVLVRKAK